MIGCTGLIAGMLAMSAGEFSDNFDKYSADTKMHWINGWHGWDDAVAAEGTVRTAFARSSTNSLETGGTTDAVQNFSVIGGKWRITIWQYIPSSSTGSNTYFILMNTYNDGGAKSWSTQVIFDLTNNLVYDNMGGAAGSTTLKKDQWVQIRVDIDLTAKTQDIYYDGIKFTTVPWNRLGGATALAALDLYGSTISKVYYDDLALVDLNATPTVKISSWREVTPDQ